MKIPADILSSVSQIGFGDPEGPEDPRDGSAFLIQQDERDFLVTAAHVVSDAFVDGVPPTSVLVWGPELEPFRIALRSIRHGDNDKIDIALLELVAPLPFELA